MAVTTPAIYSIESRLLPMDSLRHSDMVLRDQGIDPQEAFVDSEINRQHRAEAIAWLAALPDFARSCLFRNPNQFEYVNHLEQKKGE